MTLTRILSEKERKEKLLKEIQSANCLKAWFSGKKKVAPQ